MFTDTVWPAKKPDAAIIWLTEVDSASHRYGLGAEGMLASMRDCDAAIGNLLEWRDRQPEKDDIVIFVTSDHGHSTIVEFISVGDALKEAGISAGLRFGDGIDVLYRRGRAPGFWIRTFDKGLLQGVFDALAVQPWYGATFTRAIEPGSHEGILPGTLALELTGQPIRAHRISISTSRATMRRTRSACGAPRSATPAAIAAFRSAAGRMAACIRPSLRRC